MTRNEPKQADNRRETKSIKCDQRQVPLNDLAPEKDPKGGYLKIKMKPVYITSYSL